MRKKRNRTIMKNLTDGQRQIYLNSAFFGVFACVFILFLLLAFDKIPAVGGASDGQPDLTAEQSTEAPDSSEDSEAEDLLDEEVTLTVSVMGDCTLGTDEYFDTTTSLNAYYALYGPDYFFENVYSILSADDLSIANCEGTLTTLDTREDKSYAFRGDPEFASILTAGSVEAVNLANNHSSDYGEASYTDTQNSLRSAGVTTFGYDETAILEIKGITVGLIGIYELDDHLGCQTQLLSNIAAVQAQGADLIIVSFHWGTELDTVPDSYQTTLARIAIDAGADLVVGHHPHVMQGIETYNGKDIVYSLGNFCYGGNTYPSDFDTMIFQETFTFNTSKELIETSSTIIPCSVSSTSAYNDYRPTPATGTEKTRIEEKIASLSSMISSDTSTVSGSTGDTTGTAYGAGTAQTDTSGDNSDGYGNTSNDGYGTASDQTAEETDETSDESPGDDDSSSDSSLGGNSVKLFLPD